MPAACHLSLSDSLVTIDLPYRLEAPCVLGPVFLPSWYPQGLTLCPGHGGLSQLGP